MFSSTPAVSSGCLQAHMCSATFNIFSVAYAFVSDSVSFFFKAPTICCWFMLLFFCYCCCCSCYYYYYSPTSPPSRPPPWQQPAPPHQQKQTNTEAPLSVTWTNAFPPSPRVDGLNRTLYEITFFPPHFPLIGDQPGVASSGFLCRN